MLLAGDADPPFPSWSASPLSAQSLVNHLGQLTGVGYRQGFRFAAPPSPPAPPDLPSVARRWCEPAEKPSRARMRGRARSGRAWPHIRALGGAMNIVFALLQALIPLLPPLAPQGLLRRCAASAPHHHLIGTSSAPHQRPHQHLISTSLALQPPF